MYKLLFIILLVLIITIAIVLIYGIIRLFRLSQNKSNGLIVFKVDKNDNAVIRVTSKSLSGITPFDTGKTVIDNNRFVDFNDFLNYFDSKTKKQINDFVTQSLDNHKIKFVARFNKLSLKKINKKQNIFDDEIILNMRLQSAKNDKYRYITIKWRKFIDQKSTNTFQFVKADRLKSVLTKSNYLVFALQLKNRFYYEEITYRQINNILDLLKLKFSKTIISRDEGFLFIYVPFQFEKYLNKSISKKVKIVNYLNSPIRLSQNLNKICLMKIVNKKFDEALREELKWKAKYCLFNLLNSSKSQYDTFLSDAFMDSEEFIEFKNRILEFEQKNDFMNFQIDTLKISNFKTKRNLKLKFIKVLLQSLDKKTTEFFGNIYWYQIKYMKSWNEFLISSNSSDEKIIIPSNLYDLKNNLVNYSLKNTVFSININDEIYDKEFLINLINANKDLKLALFIDNVDDLTISKVSNVDAKYIIISKNITYQIAYKTDEFIKLLNFINVINSQKTKDIIYQNFPENIDEYIINKLNVKYIYTK